MPRRIGQKESASTSSPQKSNSPALIAVMGPTASGKSQVAEVLAERLDAQLIAADAFQIYRGLDIGTNKPARPERYLMVSIRDPAEPFGVGEWVTVVADHLNRLYHEGRNAIIVGGTGLYIRALFEEWSGMRRAPEAALRAELRQELEGRGIEPMTERLRSLEPAVAASIDLANPMRVLRALETALGSAEPIEFKLPPFRKFKFGLRMPPDTLAARIDERAESMFRNGWIKEVERLLIAGVKPDAPAMRAIGYSAVLQRLNGELSQEETLSKIRTQTRQYAKRQRSWMRSEPALKNLDVAGPSSQTLPDCLNRIFALIEYKKQGY